MNQPAARPRSLSFTAKAQGQGSPEAGLAQTLEALVKHRLSDDKLSLPSMPAAALRCLRLTQDASFSLATAATTIETDPLLAAQIMRLTNSAALAVREPARTVLQAVTRLGISRLRTFLIESSARRLFESKDPRISAAARGLWEHSLAVGMLARQTVARTDQGDPDFAYLAGLLHDVGKPVVGAMLLELEKDLTSAAPPGAWLSAEAWLGVVQRTHRPLGIALAERWELPTAIVTAIRGCDDFATEDPFAIGNAVRFANAVAKQLGLYMGSYAHEEVDAIVGHGRAHYRFDDTTWKRLTSNLRDNVRSQMTP
jgi:putative nucleotidyltransferase with HDIG domain